MEYLRTTFCLQNEEPQKYQEDGDGPHFEPTQEVNQEFFHTGYLPFFYDYRAVDRGLCEAREDWEWGEWENHVMVKEETVEPARSFAEDGEFFYFLDFAFRRTKAMMRFQLAYKNHLTRKRDIIFKYYFQHKFLFCYVPYLI